MRTLYLHCCCLAALFLLFACQAQDTTETPAAESEQMEMEEEEVRAVAELAPKSGSGLAGRCVFTETDGEIRFEATIENVEPGLHAIHIHQTGDCSADDASSAGGHWNPTGEEHGRWGEPPFHLGDIGNIDVGEDGSGSLTLTTDLWTLGDSSSSDVVGKAIVVHAGADDFESQPSGAAGERIGCGVIEMSEGGGEM
jgi:Cu-Zn family superoxide dismutase